MIAALLFGGVQKYVRGRERGGREGGGGGREGGRGHLKDGKVRAVKSL